MRYKILLYGLIAAAVSSCSSAYKATQTPDDVYFSPAKEGTAQKQVAKSRDRYEDYTSADDQYLHMKIRDRQRWSGIDDYTYWNDSRYVPSFNYNYDYYSANMYNPYAWNNWNRPYYNLYANPYFAGGFGGMYGYGGLYSLGYSMNNFYPSYGYGYTNYGTTYISKNPTRVLSPTGRPNLNGYSNNQYNNQNINYGRQGNNSTGGRYITPNTNRYSNRNNNTYTAPERTYSTERSYTPSYSPSSSSSSSSSSSGSSSGGGVSRPPR